MPTFRVLLVEDDAALRLLTRTQLEQAGRFEIVGEAVDGSSAIRQAAVLQPDLVLLDLAMPRMGGIEALPELRRVARAAKVVALSMMPPEKFERAALAGGAAAFIDKAVEADELVRRLLAVLEPTAPGAAMPPAGRPPRSTFATWLLRIRYGARLVLPRAIV